MLYRREEEEVEIHEEETHTFCCGGKNCPAIRREGDGVVLLDDAARVPSLTIAAAAEISFTAEQARELKKKLEEFGF